MPLPVESAILIALIACLTALGFLYALSCSIRNGVEFHDLKLRVNALRQERLAYLRQQSENETVDTGLELPGVNASSPGQAEAMTGGSAKASSKKKH